MKEKYLTMSLLLQGTQKGLLITFSVINLSNALSQCLTFFLLVRNPQKHIP